MRFHLRTKWLCVQIPLLWPKLQICRLLQARSSLTFRTTIECGFTLKLARDMVIAYSQMHHRNNYLQHSLFIWLVWLNGWVFVYELIGCGIEPSCHHLYFRYWLIFLVRSSLTFRETKDSGFTLKLVQDIITRYC